VVLLLLALACGHEPPRHEPRDGGVTLPAGDWRVEVDRPDRGRGPSVSLVVGAGRGSFQWDGPSFLGGMSERHRASFRPTQADLVAVYGEVRAAGFFDLQGGARDPSGACDSVSWRGPGRATAKCIDQSPDAEKLRRIVSAVVSVVRRHAPDFDRPTPVRSGVDRCETDADCTVARPVLRCCEACEAPMSRGLEAWHRRLRARCEDGPPCPRPTCPPPPAVRCDPYAKVCVESIDR
jgi:hypothetical protein